MVGGTGLYIKACLYDYKFNIEENKYDFSEYSLDELYNKLISIDPDTTIHKNNRKRIERALTMYYNNNEVKEKTDKLLYDVVFIGLTCDRDILYKRINDRVDIMLKNGLLDEAKKIYETGIRTKAVMTPIGYKELFEYFDGNMSLNDSIELIKKRSRNYAKRQYTWNNHQIDVNWFNVDFDNFTNTVNEVLNFINK